MNQLALTLVGGGGLFRHNLTLSWELSPLNL
jgi:hypothetical protein